MRACRELMALVHFVMVARSSSFALATGSGFLSIVVSSNHNFGYLAGQYIAPVLRDLQKVIKFET